jgi:hypothetical protein
MTVPHGHTTGQEGSIYEHRYRYPRLESTAGRDL